MKHCDSLYSNKENSAFTLIELSIVIVIIGLIVAGIVAGQSLVAQAKLRALSSDIGKYNAAFNAFQLQYDAIPGDMSNASSYWGSAIDGDGNKNITCVTGTLEETAALWQHLALAGFIEGNFDGDLASCSSTTIFDIGEDYIAGPYSNSYYVISSNGLYSTALPGTYISINRIGSHAGSTNSTMGVITPAEARSIDVKLDDGVAYTGKTRARRSRLFWTDQSSPQSDKCTSGAEPPSGTGTDYFLSDVGRNCSFSTGL